MSFKSAREKAGLTQDEVARQLGLKDNTAVSAWEKGRWNPRWDVAIRLAELYGCSLDDFRPDA